ncbi:hypothetical protein DYB37_006353 [Aphanomyces astaci]|uniref:DUF6818 domain-containing protein n=1 Tax=Aphanomyces astaci TaxID=112090 RepID=A0A3R7BYT3_APHAT|nr:hypothetical protein DYB37_006353 [Aphanomyces astaci]
MNTRKPKTKSTNFFSEETARLLDLVKELKPFGCNMCERVAFEYNRSAHATWPERDDISLKRRFQGLNNKSKPTGTAYIPPNVERAKRLSMEIESKWKKEQAEERAVWKQEQADQRRREDEQRRQESLDREEREREARKREQQHEALMMMLMAKFLGSSN